MAKKKKSASGATPKRKTAPASKKRREVEAWEKEEAIRWLALTDSISQTARQMGRDVAVIHRIKTANIGQITKVRQELVRDLHVEFVTAIRVIQQKVIDSVGAMKLPESQSDQAKFLDSLGKILSTEVEKQALLLEKPTDIARIDGSGGEFMLSTLSPEEEEIERATDKDYLRELLDEIDEENGDLP